MCPLFNLNIKDAAYTIGLILLNEKAIEAVDSSKKKCKFVSKDWICNAS